MPTPASARDLSGEPRRGLGARIVQLGRQATQLAFRGSERLGRGSGGVEALVDRVELGLRGRRPRQQLLVRLRTKPPLRLGDVLQLALHLLEPARLRFERGQ